MMRTLFWALATFIASPVLLFGCVLRGKRKPPQKVLVIRGGRLGDLLTTARMFQAIKKTYPNCKVHVCCKRGSSIVLRENPYIDKIHFVDDGSRWQLLKVLRAEKFDWSINCMPDSFGSMIGLWANIPQCVTTVSKLHGYLIPLLSRFVKTRYSYGLHQSTYDHYMKLLEPLGIKPLEYGVDFFWSRGDEEVVNKWLKKEGIKEKSFVIINPTAGNAIKQWPPTKFVELCNYITEELGLAVVLSTLNLALLERIRTAAISSDKVLDASQFTLAQMGALCCTAKAFISSDTGPLYVAYAAGAPVVVIVGPVDPREQIPREGPHTSHVLPPEGSTPWVFIAATPKKGTVKQMESILGTSVESVIEGLNKVIG